MTRRILDLVICEDDDSRMASRAYRATLRRDERWPAAPLGSPAWDYGLILLGLACVSILLWAQYP